MGLGGFQEAQPAADVPGVHQVPGPCLQPQAHGRVHRPRLRPRHLDMGPTQLNIPRDYFYGEHHLRDPEADPHRARRRRPREPEAAAAELLATAKFPVILRRRRGDGRRLGRRQALAERIGCPVVNSYQHNDSFPAATRSGAARWATRAARPACADRRGRRGDRAGHAPGPLRHAAAVRHGLLAEERQAGADRRRPRMLGLVKKVDVGICGDAKAGRPRAAGAAGRAHAGLRRHQGRARAKRRPRRRSGRRSSPSGRTSATPTAWT
jgi:sulfoacetaldehyde acetyltransferase